MNAVLFRYTENKDFFSKLGTLIVFALTMSSPASAAQSASVQKSECIGPEGAKVEAVYMPGWYEKQGDTAFVRLEASNREKLRKLAEEKGIRIAVIVTEKMSGRYRSWDHGTTLKEVNKAAQQICGEGSLSTEPKPALIGFSSGGYAARLLGCRANEDEVREQFSKILVLGAPPMRVANCRRDYMVYKNDIEGVHALNLDHLSSALDYLGETEAANVSRDPVRPVQ